MHYSGSNYKDYLEKLLGSIFLSECQIETNATAGKMFIKVNRLNYKKDSKLINVLKNDLFVYSVFVINKNKIKQLKPYTN